MELYVVFAWDPYDAFGGIRDQKGSFPDLASAIAFATAWECWDIVDRDTWRLIESND